MTINNKQFFVYIMASSKNGSIYTGMTSDITGRVWEHKNKVHPNSHTVKYYITRLVYFEQYEDAETAIDREKLIKSKSRAYRIKLIEKDNPDWSELYHTLD